MSEETSYTMARQYPGELSVTALTDELVRVSFTKDGSPYESLLNRYGILADDFDTVEQCRINVAQKEDTICISAPGVEDNVSIERFGDGYRLHVSLLDAERVYGLGDVDRTTLNRRGKRYDNWVANSKANIPIPMVICSGGWGIIFNSTFRGYTDVGCESKDELIFAAEGGEPDFYFFVGSDYRQLLATYTRLAGRPALLPIWGYGYTYVCNINIDEFGLMNEAYEFRKLGIPCDVIGLEPGWMEKNYDLTTRKTWHPDRFRISYWQQAGEHTFIGGLDRIGFKLSLWLCCDYDLTRYEEELLAGTAPVSKRTYSMLVEGDSPWQDERIGDLSKIFEKKPDARDQYEEGTRPWFEHLEGFVLQGARAFKMDGCNQLGQKADRVYYNGRTGVEMHNIYPVIYAKQMADGYRKFTGRRPMCYSSGGYAGVQKYVATWAGDTGGSSASLASLLNLGVSGHSNTSCDMEINDVEALHFGFLQAWSQQANWDYWQQPWLREGDAFEAVRDYAKLRYRLLPYIYTAARKAHDTGWPIMRPLCFVWPDIAEYDDVITTYMFGDDLLVSAFADETVIPPGEWFDWFTGEKVIGPCRRKVVLDSRHGGGLYVRGGAVIPTWPELKHVDKGWNDEIVWEVWPSRPGRGGLYEDDGNTMAFENGEFSMTEAVLEIAADGEPALKILPRKGSFAGAEKAPPFKVQIISARTRHNVIDTPPDPSGERIYRIVYHNVK